MANHRCKELDDLFAAIKSLGFRVIQEGINLKIYPPDKSIAAYYGHMGERGFHPIRRWLKNVCKVEWD